MDINRITSAWQILCVQNANLRALFTAASEATAPWLQVSW
jgi:hypothetical protein